MVSPLILQVLFWSGIAGCCYGAWVLYTLDNWAWVMALAFGPLITRVIFERLIIGFKTYDELVRISSLLERADHIGTLQQDDRSTLQR